MSVYAVVLFAMFAANGEHLHDNPLFRELRDTGVPVSATLKVPLPAPAMADGLDGEAQMAVLKNLAHDDFDLKTLLDKSVVAPHLFPPLRAIANSDPKAPARGLDVYFVAYGNLDTITNKDFLSRLLESNKKEGKGESLTSADLEKRKIAIKSEDEKFESYGHIVFDLLDKVEISAVGHSYWSRTDDSIVMAAQLDPRFEDDKDYPNQWKSLSKKDDGSLQSGPANPYSGAGYYLKITRLAKPAGALFVEGHVVFTEPVKWFDGEGLLRSKLPVTVQAQVRAMRRELLKAGQ
jgi:hypothetical protein